MPYRELNDAIQKLERLASDDGSWRPLLDEAPELRARVAWLRERLEDVPTPLVAVLFGGTGTGKSTLLNALAGERIAEAGERRPTTAEPTVYLPPGAAQDFGSAKYIESACLGELILIDTPDTDSIRPEHCERVTELLHRADVVLFCGTQQKYKNEKSLALLRAFKNERKIVCIQTRADEDADVREDWLARLRSEGFSLDHCFRVSAAAALAGESEDSFEFEALQAYVKEQLPPERMRIKAHNLEGAIGNTLGALRRRFEGRGAQLRALDRRLAETEQTIARTTFDELQERLLNETHVWVVALGDAVAERAFGLIGTLFRILHWVRMLPSRTLGRLSLAGLLQSVEPRGSGASEDAPGKNRIHDGLLRRLAEVFGREHADVNAQLARAGFPCEPFEAWQDDFSRELRARLDEYLSPVQQRVNVRAGRLARWMLPVFDLLWIVPFVMTLATPLYNYYWNLVRHMDLMLPQPDFLARAASMLGVVLFVELALFTAVVRWAGRGLRNRSKRDLAKGLQGGGFGLGKQRAEVRRALDALEGIDAAGE
ncbi:MAG: hypothetical protein GWP08_15220 [Nitrospiraceae bacterium]|nr:hypothetical protein [Nitrospiraceae bacterium]